MLHLENTRVQWEKRVPNKVMRTVAKDLAWGVTGIDGEELQESETLYIGVGNMSERFFDDIYFSRTNSNRTCRAYL